MSALLALVVAASTVPAGHALTLQEAETLAFDNQPLLRQARADVMAAEARIETSRAGLLPQLSANAQYSRQNGVFINQTGTPTDTGTTPTTSTTGTDNFNFGVSFSQLVWDFGQVWNRYRASQSTAQAQQQNETQRKQQALFAVRSAFFAAVASKGLVKVAEETLENQDKHLKQIEGFVEVGTRPSIDLAQAKTDRANAKVQLITAKNGWDSARAQLLQAMGIEQAVNFDVNTDTMPMLEDENRDSETVIAAAQSARSELAALAANIEAQERSIWSVRAAYLPSIGLSATAGEQGRELDALRFNWRVGVTLQWNFFSGLSTHGQEREAEANLMGLQAQLDGQRQQVRLEAEQARLGVLAAVGTVDATEEALVNAKTRLTLAEGRYQAGSGNSLELSDAQLTVTAAGSQRVQADYTLATARAQLLKALGK